MSRYYLKLDGIPGDSDERGLEGWLAVSSVTWLTANAGPGGASGAGGGPGRANFDRIATDLAAGMHGQILFMKSANGEPIGNAELRVFKDKALSVSARMSGVVVESCRFPSGPARVEVVFNYDKIKFTYGQMVAPRDLQHGLPSGRR